MVRGVHQFKKRCLIRKRRTKAEILQAKTRRKENEELLNAITISNEQNSDESANEQYFVELPEIEHNENRFLLRLKKT